MFNHALIPEKELMPKMAIANAFNKASTSYDKHASLQRQVGHDLITFAAPYLQKKARTLLDAGCGTGYFSRYWQDLGYQVTALDIAENMLQQAKQNQVATHYIQADLEQLSRFTLNYDIIFSNMAIQWCSKFANAIAQLYQTTKQTLLFSTIVDDSLYELNDCRQILDGNLQGNRFLSQDELLANLTPYCVNWHKKSYTLTFPSIMPLLFSLKGVGATYQYQQTKRGLTTEDYFKRLQATYYQQYGELRLTYHIFHGVIDCGK